MARPVLVAAEDPAPPPLDPVVPWVGVVELAELGLQSGGDAAAALQLLQMFARWVWQAAPVAGVPAM